jgi:predicted NBD/HSP70 family sugar kinase
VVRKGEGTLSWLKERNRQRVIEALRSRGGLSQAEIARATGLSRTTISTLVGELRSSGLLRVTDPVLPGTRGGRPGVQLLLEDPSQVVLAINFGHRHLQVAVGGLDHEILVEREVEVDVDHRAIAVLDLSAQLVAEVLASAGLERRQVRGAAIAVPGPINQSLGTVGSTTILPDWVGLHVAEQMQERLGVPIAIENDANLGALGELAWGEGRGCSNFAYIKAATGIGAGLVVDGRLLRGRTGTAGEIGHVTLDEKGALCYCGSRGCLETVASGPAIVRRVAEGGSKNLELAEVIERALGGDWRCARAIADAGREIGVAVAGVCNLLNPERVIVGGTLSRAGDLLLDPLRESISRLSVQAAAESVQVVRAHFVERSEVMGCLALAMREFVAVAA